MKSNLLHFLLREGDRSPSVTYEELAAIGSDAVVLSCALGFYGNMTEALSVCIEYGRTVREQAL